MAEKKDKEKILKKVVPDPEDLQIELGKQIGPGIDKTIETANKAKRLAETLAPNLLVDKQGLGALGKNISDTNKKLNQIANLSRTVLGATIVDPRLKETKPLDSNFDITKPTPGVHNFFEKRRLGVPTGEALNLINQIAEQTKGPQISQQEVPKKEILNPPSNIQTLTGEAKQRSQASAGIVGGITKGDFSGTGAGSINSKLPETKRVQLGDADFIRTAIETPDNKTSVSFTNPENTRQFGTVTVNPESELGKRFLEVQRGERPGGTVSTVNFNNVLKSADAQLERDKLDLIRSGQVPVSEIDTPAETVLQRLQSGAYNQQASTSPELPGPTPFELNKQKQDLQRELSYLRFKLNDANPIERKNIQAQMQSVLAQLGNLSGIEKQQIKTQGELAKTQATQAAVDPIKLAQLNFNREKEALNTLEKRKDRESKQKAEILKQRVELRKKLSEPTVFGDNAIPLLQGLFNTGAKRDALALAVSKGFTTISDLDKLFPSLNINQNLKNKQFAEYLAGLGVRLQ